MKKKIIWLFLFVLLIIGGTHKIVYAKESGFKIDDTNVIEKSQTLSLNDTKYEGLVIDSDVTFYTEGDYIAYKVKLLNNNDYDYTINSISDDNTLENVKVEYRMENDQKVIKAKETGYLIVILTYTEELDDTFFGNGELYYLEELNIKLNTTHKVEATTEEDSVEDQTSKNPITLDKIMTYIVLLILGILGILGILFIKFRKGKTLRLFIFGITAALLAVGSITYAYADTYNEVKETVVVTFKQGSLKIYKRVGYLVIDTKVDSNTEPTLGNANVARNKIEKVYTLTDQVVPANAIASWDASAQKNGTITAYILDANGNGLYELYVGQDGGVKANPDSEKLFNFYTSLTSADLSNLDLRNTTTIASMFQSDGKLATITGLENWNTSKVEHMEFMFQNCTVLANLNSINSWDVSNAINMRGMFNKCKGLTEVRLPNWSANKVKDVSDMFLSCTKLQVVDLSGFGAESAQNMSGMFQSDTKLVTVIGVENWDTKSATELSGMFFGDTKLENIDLSNLNTSNVTNFQYMFYNCKSLDEINVSNWDTRKAEQMPSMFFGCSAIETLDVSDWDTKNVTNMSSMFSGCSGLTTLDVSNWDTKNVINMSSMFFGCSIIETLDVSNWGAASVTNTSHMFDECRKLKKLDMSNWDMSNLTKNNSMFQYGYELTEIKLPDNYTTVDSFMFNHNQSYVGTSFTIPKSVVNFGKSHMWYDFGNGSFKEFIVEEGNTGAKTVDGILYTYDGTRLISIPRGKAFNNDEYIIPEGVTYLNELAFNRSNHIKTVVLPNTYQIVRSVATDDEILNPGNSLSVAIYLHTAVDTYVVKDDNPNYVSYEGCIYSKDGKELITVPTHYSGVLNIKDGTETIGVEAFWTIDSGMVGAKTTNINIPASVTSIEAQQLVTLNRLGRAKATNGDYKTIISIDDGNTNYKVVNNQIVNK